MDARMNKKQSLAAGSTRSTKRELEPGRCDVLHLNGSRLPEFDSGELVVGAGSTRVCRLLDVKEFDCFHMGHGKAQEERWT